MTIYHQTAVKGLNLAKATEDQLNDLSSYELVDAVIAYRKDYEYKQQECEKIKNSTFAIIQQRNKAEDQVDELLKNRDKLKQVLSEIKGNAYCIMNDDEDEGSCYDRAREIVDKIDEVLND